MKINVVIVEDHPLIVDAYKNALRIIQSEDSEKEFSVNIYNNCDAAITGISSFRDKEEIDMAILDIQVPPSADGKYLSGEDIGMYLKRLFPEVKIIISTSFNDNFRIHSILKNLDPDGFMIKSEITPEELINGFKTVLDSPPFYNASVLQLLRKQNTIDFMVDHIDRKLLYELSQGAKLKELPELLPLSIAGVEKRRRRLKELFGTKSSSDKELISIAKEKGFL
ncbi:response regulator [Robertkochia solimangrovi]|uniref:response regulator n=1 Tax=Robertkochia solimangrovi TaxID=2213046 RepID=UPI0013A58256|nr:response regulator [Robertkochia solimangrovi]